MICARCGRETAESICEECGQDALLDGRYRLEEIVGRGAAGTTYRATRLSDDAVYAVKELDFRRIDSFKTQSLFEREATVLEQLDHPGIPQYVDNFTFGDGKHLAFCLVQEFIEGHTLADELSKTRYDEREALEVLDELLGICEYLHSRQPPVIHRDLKPKNVMRRAGDDSLVIIDFGSVREVLEDPEAGGSTIAGTFGFMAPEQFQGVAMPATDIYGLGALTVAMLARKRPQEMLDLTNRLHWQPHVNVGPATRQLLEQMLEPVYHDRLSDAAEAREELGRVFDVLDGRRDALVPTVTDYSSDAEPGSPGVNSDPRYPAGSDTSRPGLIAVGAATVLLTLGAGFALMGGSDSNDGPRRVEVTQGWEDSLHTVQFEPIGRVGHISLDMNVGRVRAAGTEQAAAVGEEHVIPTVVGRHRSDCVLQIRDGELRRIECPLALDWSSKGPSGMQPTVDYLTAKYGEPASEEKRGHTRRWTWRGTNAVMFFDAKRRSPNVDATSSRLIVQRPGTVEPPRLEEGGRDPFQPAELPLDEQ